MLVLLRTTKVYSILYCLVPSGLTIWPIMHSLPLEKCFWFNILVWTNTTMTIILTTFILPPAKAPKLTQNPKSTTLKASNCNADPLCQNVPYFPLFSEPVRLHGQGDFALTDVMLMESTEGFLSLDVSATECQNETTVLECRSMKYLETGKELCRCVPHYLRSYHKSVSFNSWIKPRKYLS